MDPTLREDVADRTSESLIAVARTRRRRGHNAIEQKMPLVERIIRPRKPHRSTAILDELFYPRIIQRGRRSGRRVAVHDVILTRAGSVNQPGVRSRSSRLV